jgi:hypothetical protein
MTELQRYDQGGQIGQPADGSATYSQLSPLDHWVLVVRDVSRLASTIADTPFVPDGMRGNPAAVTAAILTGREMGLGPMTSLQHIHVIKGKPGKSAEIMRGMVLASGHHIRDVEVTDTRAVLEGRRRDEDQWTRVTFTADQARRAKIDLGGYPEDKLYARATTRLCRRKFADVVGGISMTIDELEDTPDDASGATAAPAPTAPADAPATPKRTAKRRTAPKKDPAAASPPTAKPEPAGSSAEKPADQSGEDTNAPPLPGDEPDEEPPTGDGVTRPQLDKLHAQLGELGVTDRADKLTTVSLLVRRELVTSQDLTKAEANSALDTLSHVLAADDPAKALDAVLAAAMETQE